MFFNSLQYMVFLAVTFTVYYLTADSYRWLILLVASFIFYASLNIPYLLLALLFVIVITYYIGLRLDQCKNDNNKKRLLLVGIVLNIMVLLCLKYLPLITEAINLFFKIMYPVLSIPISPTLVSIAVSYYVFQAISYLIDIYLEINKSEKHIGCFALYLSFFPRLLQGPIERSSELIPQIKTKYEFNYNMFCSGLLLLCSGLFKKAVIADRIAIFVNPVYNNVHSYSSSQLLFATYLYAFQLYYDFSGYTDMALGTALLFNIKLTQNFKMPYFATSISDFWRRWHISFSRWILDYIFKPLQMKWRNKKTWGTAGALMVTFLVSGVWHGASFGFIIWGGLHGLYLSISVFYKPFQKKIHKLLGLDKSIILKIWQTVVTFNLVCFAWIFFRANCLNDAFYIISKILTASNNSHVDFYAGRKEELFIALFFVFITLCLEYIYSDQDLNIVVFRQPLWLKILMSYLIIMIITVFGLFYNKGFSYVRF